MSRIHEALKKAEQERAATQGGSAQPSLATTPVADSPVYDAPASVMAAVATSTQSAPAFASSFGLDTLVARTAQMEWKPDLGTMLFMNSDDGARGTEEFRTLRSRLYHMREKMTLKTLLGPRLHLMLGTTPGPGLSDYLQGRNDEFSIMQRGPLENLFFIPSGTGIEDPAELVGNGKLKMLLQRVGPLFDWIIIDSPPAVPVSDASLLSKACDGVIMVVRSNSTPSDVARKARQEFPDQALVGIVLNGTSDEAAPYARYYYEAYQKKPGTTKA